MSEPRTDPLDALRAPTTPLAPDPAFAADLRARLARALLAPIPKEPAISTETTIRPRNGTRHDDVSYITLGLPDLAHGRAFYGAVLGGERNIPWEAGTVSAPDQCRRAGSRAAVAAAMRRRLAVRRSPGFSRRTCLPRNVPLSSWLHPDLGRHHP